MTLLQIEQLFNRAFAESFSKKKFLFLFPILLCCGLLVVFCRTLSLGVNDWVWMSLSFLPIFLSTGVLLAAGVLLTKMYIFEMKGTEYKIGKLFTKSLQLLMGVSYLCFPLTLAYLVLWAVMGVFYLMKKIPAFGDFFGTLLSFGPYLLVLGSFSLAILSVMLLFFITPQVALKKNFQMNIALEIRARIQRSVFANSLLFFVAIIPVSLVCFFLVTAASMTGSSYYAAQDALGVGIQWLVIMIPFCFLMTPFIIFFFNFSLESYLFLKKQSTGELDKKQESSCLV